VGAGGLMPHGDHLHAVLAEMAEDRPDVAAVDGEAVAHTLLAQDAADQRAAVDARRVALGQRPSDGIAHAAGSVCHARWVARCQSAAQAGVGFEANRVYVRRMSARDAILAAFDELYDSAAAKLNVPSTPEDRAEPRARFAERFDKALELAGTVEMHEIPRPVLDQMKEAISKLSMSELAGVVAGMPLAQQTGEMLRAIAMRQAEQRLLEQLALEADTRYG